MDDLLLGAQTQNDCQKGSNKLLNWLATCGYKISKEKAQLVKQEVKYLEYRISKGTRMLLAPQKEAVCKLKPPESQKQLTGILGMAGFCRIWIPNFGLMAKPLYEATKGGD